MKQTFFALSTSILFIFCASFLFAEYAQDEDVADDLLVVEFPTVEFPVVEFPVVEFPTVSVPGIQAAQADRNLLPASVAPTLGILPFSGSAGNEGDIIATLLSGQASLLNAFNVVPRAAFGNIPEKHGLLLTGLTDPAKISGIVNQLGTDYILSGSIRRIGDENILIAIIVNVENFEQVAGYYRIFHETDEILSFLPTISEKLARTAFGHNRLGRQNLAINSFRDDDKILDSILSPEYLDTLTQIFSIELLNTGHYTILPRSEAVQEAIRADRNRMANDPASARLGRASDAALVLYSTVSRLGTTNVFAAQIIDAATGQIAAPGAFRNFQTITVPYLISFMPEFAIILTADEPNEHPAIMDRIAARQQEDRARRQAEIRTERDARRRQAELYRERRRIQAEIDREQRNAQEEAERERRRIQEEAQRNIRNAEQAQARQQRIANATRDETERFSTSVVLLGEGEEQYQGLSFSLFLSGLYWSPFPFANIGIETRITALSRGLFDNFLEGGEGITFDMFEWYFSVSPTLGFVFPLGRATRLYINGIVDVGFLPRPALLWNSEFEIFDRNLGITPGIGAGLSFGRRTTFTFNYRGTLFDGGDFSHSFGIGIGRLR